MQRSLRLAPHESKLWLEYFRLELLYVRSLRSKRSLLTVTDEDEDEDENQQQKKKDSDNDNDVSNTLMQDSDDEDDGEGSDHQGVPTESAKANPETVAAVDEMTSSGKVRINPRASA